MSNSLHMVESHLELTWFSSKATSLYDYVGVTTEDQDHSVCVCVCMCLCIGVDSYKRDNSRHKLGQKGKNVLTYALVYIGGGSWKTMTDRRHKATRHSWLALGEMTSNCPWFLWKMRPYYTPSFGGIKLHPSQYPQGCSTTWYTSLENLGLDREV